jgi:16S rRNA (uracil1498-N3)-methyltransferase
MPPRFFVEQPVAEDTIELVDAEAHHLLHVLRAKTGDSVTLFDGTGREFAGEVGRLRRSSVEVLVRSQAEVDRESPRRLVVGVALPKGDRQRWLVEKLVELGVAECVPLETARGVAQPEGGTLEKLRRAVIEASKQCGRNRLMAISHPQAWSQFVALPPATALRRVAHPRTFWPEVAANPASPKPAGESLGEFIESIRISPPDSPVFAAIGPEGGFAASEIAEAFAAGWRLVSLGSRILRIETAALALATAVATAADN